MILTYINDNKVLDIPVRENEELKKELCIEVPKYVASPYNTVPHWTSGVPHHYDIFLAKK